jgi:hypothetical protein
MSVVKYNPIMFGVGTVLFSVLFIVGLVICANYADEPKPKDE